MKRLLAMMLLVAGVGYFVVKEFPQDKVQDETNVGKIDMMMDRLENSEPF